MTGGASTNRGVLAQALWSLFRLSPAGAAVVISDDETADTIQLILEPKNGGDIALAVGGERVVEQIKSRSGGRPWSFSEFVTDVLPDLFKAAATSALKTKYRFVTDGRMGEWSDARAFFKSLSTRTFDQSLESLKDSTTLRIGQTKKTIVQAAKSDPPKTKGGHREAKGKRAFEVLKNPTKRTLFIAICCYLHQLPEADLTADRMRLVWCFLGAIEIEDGIAFAASEAVIDEWRAGRFPDSPSSCSLWA